MKPSIMYYIAIIKVVNKKNGPVYHLDIKKVVNKKK